MRNPLRVLDSKNPTMAEVLRDAPQIADHWSAESRAHFEGLKGHLTALGVDFEETPRLVRGLDYYTHTVFEWVADSGAAQAAVGAGGRYDGLVSELGGAPTPAVGFAIGMERLMSLVTRLPPTAPTDVYVLTAAAWQGQALRLAEGLRDAGLKVEVHLAGASFKSQMKRARDSGARCLVQARDRQGATFTVGAGGPGEEAPWDDLVLRISQALGAEADSHDE